MPCKNKLDILYFVVASFTWLLRAEQEPFFPTHQKPQRGIVIAFWTSERTMFIESDSTKVGETDTCQPPVCKARRQNQSHERGHVMLVWAASSNNTAESRKN